MSEYAALLAGMMDAIVSGDTTRCAAVTTEQTRMAVYRDAYRTRLLGLLHGAYPATTRLADAATFDAAAAQFIQATPPRDFNAERYPVGFANFCSGLQAIPLPVKELAQLESAMAAVYLGDETPPLSAEWIAHQSPQSIAAVRLTLRAASRLMAFRHDVSGYVDAVRAGGDPGPPLSGVTHILVLRHRHRLWRHRLEAEEYTLLALLQEGLTLGAALEHESLRDGAEPETLQRWFARWAVEGFMRQPE